MTFIDENCVIFDNDEENKMVYYDKFNAFRQLIDNLLETHLKEIGVTEEAFAEACEAGMDSRPENKDVFEKLIAVDDFLTFKKLMVKRNIELELEVVEAMKNAGQTLAGPRSKDEEDFALSAAIEQSRDAGGKDGGGSGGKQSDVSDEARKKRELQEAIELKSAMEANLFEMQLYAKQMELEQAELEKALALSLQLEERRLEKLKLEQELISAQEELQEKTEQMARVLASSEGKRAVADVSEDKSERVATTVEREERDFVRQEREDIRSRTGGTPGGKSADDSAATTAADATSPSRRRGEGKSSTSSSASPSSSNMSLTSLSGMPGVKPSPEGKTSSSSWDPMSEPMREDPMSSSSSRDSETPEERKRRKERKKKKKEKRDREKEEKRRRRKQEKDSSSSTTTMSDLPPMGRSALAPLPELGAKLQNDKRAAQEQFRLNQIELEERKKQQKEMQKIANIDNDEMERRSAYLRKQRDLLIKKKAEERKRQLQDYEARRRATNTTAAEEFANAKENRDRDASSKQSDNNDTTKNEPKKELTAAQKKRRDMMKSLGMQMKTDLVKKEEKRINDVQIQQYSALDRQLRLAEEQRKDRQRKQHELMDQMRQDKLIRAMNVQSSAFANRIIHNEKDFSFKEN
jgi:hypothetical protein